MRRNVIPSNRGQDTGAGAPAPVPTPNTPRKGGAALDRLIRSLEDEYGLGLIQQGLLSPSQRSDALTGKVYGQIKRLYWSSEPALEEALEKFRQIASGFAPEQHLGLLHGTLKSQLQSPLSKAGTPSSSQARRSDVSLRTLVPSATRSASRVIPTPGRLQLHRHNTPAALEPGSPTDVDTDEDEFVTPSSPTLSSQAAQRRVQQASPNARSGSGIMGRKRASDSSDGPISSPKLTRTLKGKQPAVNPPNVGSSNTSATTNLFKKPSFDMARSFQAAAPIASSANTSFNSIWSAERTQPSTTATTSFASDAYDPDVRYPKLPRTDSTTTTSLDEQDLAEVSAQLARETAESELRRSQGSQELTQESSSTFGSVDEDSLLETSFHVEAELGVLGTPDLRLAPLTERTSAASVTQRPTSATFHPPITPTKSRLQPPRTSSPSISPSKKSYFIQEIPDQHLFVEQLPHHLEKLPYHILFICCRVANEIDMSMNDLMDNKVVNKVQHNSNSLWKALERPLKARKAIYQEPARVLSAARNFDGYTFKGRVIFCRKPKKAVVSEKPNKPVFSLQLLPIEPEKSCRLQRKFGSHRFLYLNLPPFTDTKSKPERFTSDDMRDIQEQWKSWYHKEHSFLGRKWRAFHIEPIKRKKQAGRSKEDDSDRRMVMFATEGIDIEPVPLGKMLNWFFPFAQNMDQSFCKASTRFDLGLSRTIPTLTFKPSQIHYIDDITADGMREDTRFNDSDLTWNEVPKAKEVMNDGCSRMSVGAALEIWKSYRHVTDTRNEPMPSVFQGRIGGAKGLWMACGEPSTTDTDELDIWIEITPSQRKFKPHLEDQSDEHFDALRTTFEHLKHSSRPTSSELHISFIPIMVDRGVPQNVIASIINDRLDAERDELLEMLSDPVKLHRWLHKLSPSITDEITLWQAALPHSLPNKISLLLQSGLCPKTEPYLAGILERYIKQQQIWMEQKIRVPLGKATYLFGVADPLGVLDPGEVHIDFSTPFVDEISGSTYRTLNNKKLLVARQPACRRSDIQKVRAVKHPELSFLVDVVVFPSKGQYPLAGKLQGGDYDGDTYWICWEPDLVGPFKNAPAPLVTLDHEQYGIKQDTRKLKEVMSHRDLSTVDNLLREVLEFRMAPSLLGIVTNFLEKQVYAENRLYSRTLNALCDLHDLLVDAPKSGFRFDQEDYNKVIRYDLRCGNPGIPAYKQAMDDCANSKELGTAEQTHKKKYKRKKDNLLDYLYFDVVRKHNTATLQSVLKTFCKDVSNDSDMQYPYKILVNSDSEVIREELASLVTRIEKIDRAWGWKLKSSGETLTSKAYNEVVDASYTEFRSLMPSNEKHEDIKLLLTPYLHEKFSVWESIRASAAYTTLPKRHVFVWPMAGRELVKLKGGSMPGVRMVIPSIFSNLKPKPVKAPKLDEDEDESEDEYQTALEHVSV